MADDGRDAFGRDSCAVRSPEKPLALHTLGPPNSELTRGHATQSTVQSCDQVPVQNEAEGCLCLSCFVFSEFINVFLC